MPASGLARLMRLLGRVALVYMCLFVLWLFVADDYHLLLARGAACLIPLVVDAKIERVWLAEGGVRFDILFTERDENSPLRADQAVAGYPRIDITQYGYPLLTFMALALGIPGPRWPRKTALLLLGVAVLFCIYSTWVMVAVYQALADNQDIPFLRSNAVLRLVPPDLYARYKIPLLVILGQVLPVSLYGILLFRPQLRPLGGRTRRYRATGK